MTKMKANRADGEGVAGETPRGRGRPQLRSDEETRALILEAARFEFSHTGYGATNMENVARRAGVALGAGRRRHRLHPER